MLGQPDALASARRLTELLRDPQRPYPVALGGSGSTLEELPAELHCRVSYTSPPLGSLLQILNSNIDRAMAAALLAELGGPKALVEYLRRRLVTEPAAQLDPALLPSEAEIRLEGQELHLSPVPWPICGSICWRPQTRIQRGSYL